LARTSPVPQRAETLDLLRAIAAIGVVSLHTVPLAKRVGISTHFNGLGETGVSLFFVLSGYLITSSVISTSFSARSYIVNRSFRILPAYFVSMLLVLFLQDSSYLATAGGWKDVTAHVFLVQSWFKEYRVSINPVLWTLSIEWLFYIFMFVCAPLIRRARVRWIVVGGMFAGALVYRVWMSRRFEGQPATLNFYYKQLPGVLDQFACGMVAAFAVRHLRIRRLVSSRAVAATGLVVALAGVAFALAMYHRHGPNVPFVGYWTRSYMIVLWPVAFGAAIALLIVCILPFEGTLAPWIRRSGLGFIGLASYSLYLLHPLVIRTFNRGFDSRAITVPGKLYFAFMLIAVLATALGGYLLVEKPFMDKRKRYLMRPAPEMVLPTRDAEIVADRPPVAVP
jgi:peptidoglycan/LPS O-acetylase OafA/YrhL